MTCLGCGAVCAHTYCLRDLPHIAAPHCQAARCQKVAALSCERLVLIGQSLGRALKQPFGMRDDGTPQVNAWRRPDYVKPPRRTPREKAYERKRLIDRKRVSA